MQQWIRVFFSHEFSDLLVGQMEATLEKQDINVRMWTSKLPGGELKCWPDFLADDYIYRPLQKEFDIAYLLLMYGACTHEARFSALAYLVTWSPFTPLLGCEWTYVATAQAIKQ
jgi:hypothetical protein